MTRYIGLDAHTRSCTLVVVGPGGQKLKTEVVETNGQALVEAIKLVPRPRHLCMEEGTQCGWLYEVLRPHVEELVVVGPQQSKGNKNDALDAQGLAEGLRLGSLKTRVYKEEGAYGRLRELGRVYQKLVRDDVRAHNRVRSLFRSRVADVSGDSLYDVERRPEWLRRLPEKMRTGAELLFAQSDMTRELRKRAEKELVEESKKHKVSRILRTCPGLGPIRVALLQAIVVSPHRFRSRRQFWAYCGLGIVTRSSSDWAQDGRGQWSRAKVALTRGLNYNHNRTLKWLFKGAAMTIVTQRPGDELHKDYQRMLEQGTKPPLARLTLARKVSALALSMWKHQQEYDSSKKRGDQDP